MFDNLADTRLEFRYTCLLVAVAFAGCKPACASDGGDATAGEGATDISAAHYHACWVRSDGAIACRGSDDFAGQKPPSGTFVEVATTHRRGCARREDGSVACWGHGFDGSRELKGPFRSIALGVRGVCGLGEDGRVSCWTDDAPLKRSGTYQSLAMGWHHACGIAAENRVECWAVTTHGRVGDQPDEAMKALNDALGASGAEQNYVAVAAGGSTTCALTDGGDIQCHGLVDEVPEGNFVDLDVGGGVVCGVGADGGFDCSSLPMPDWVYMKPKDGASSRDELARKRRQKLTEKYGPFEEVVVGDQIRCVLSKSGQVQCVGAKAGEPSTSGGGLF